MPSAWNFCWAAHSDIANETLEKYLRVARCNRKILAVEYHGLELQKIRLAKLQFAAHLSQDSNDAVC